jgi:hypothetical protein
MVSFPGEDGIEVRPFAELFPFSFHLDSK